MNSSGRVAWWACKVAGLTLYVYITPFPLASFACIPMFHPVFKPNAYSSHGPSQLISSSNTR